MQENKQTQNQIVKSVRTLYSISSFLNIPEKSLKQLIEIIEEPKNDVLTVLGGRGVIKKADFPEMGPVIIKTYLRGGFIRHFLKQTYANLGKTRCQIEFDNLLKAKNMGINTPEPIAYITKGKFLYEAWLITKEIEHDYSLAQLSLIDGEKAVSYMNEIVRQLSILIENNIYHVDFHPGNILIGKDNNIYFIDFDKAGTSSNKNILCRNYIKRWERAVKKYDLPDELSQYLREGLSKTNNIT